MRQKSVPNLRLAGLARQIRPLLAVTRRGSRSSPIRSHEKFAVSREKSEQIVVAVFKVIKAALLRGEEVRIKDFGLFYTVRRSERWQYSWDRKLKLTEVIYIPARTVALFHPTKSLARFTGTVSPSHRQGTSALRKDPAWKSKTRPPPRQPTTTTTSTSTTAK